MAVVVLPEPIIPSINISCAAPTSQHYDAAAGPIQPCTSRHPGRRARHATARAPEPRITATCPLAADHSQSLNMIKLRGPECRPIADSARQTHGAIALVGACRSPSYRPVGWAAHYAGRADGRQRRHPYLCVSFDRSPDARRPHPRTPRLAPETVASAVTTTWRCARRFAMSSRAAYRHTRHDVRTSERPAAGVIQPEGWRVDGSTMRRFRRRVTTAEAAQNGWF